MRFIFSFIVAASTFFMAGAQIIHPVKWSFEVKKVGDGEFDLISTAKMDKGWHVYSQFLKDDGPIPTVLTFKPSSAYQLIGKASEISDHKESGYDKLFMMDVTKFSQQVSFVQRVKVSDATQPIKGSVRYGTCDDERCLPPDDVDFSFTLPASASSPTGNGGTASAPPAKPAAR